jgi:hypothetical protein
VIPVGESTLEIVSCGLSRLYALGHSRLYRQQAARGKKASAQRRG